MRNLSLLRTRQDVLAGHVEPTTSVSAVALDLDEDALYIAAERQTQDADVEVEVWKLEHYAERDSEYDFESVSSHILHQHDVSQPAHSDPPNARQCV